MSHSSYMISPGSIKTSSETESVKFSSTFSVLFFFLGDVRRARGGFLFGSSLKLFQECKTGLAPSSKRIRVPPYVLRNASHKVLCSFQPRSHLCYCVSLQDYTTNLLFFNFLTETRKTLFLFFLYYNRLLSIL